MTDFTFVERDLKLEVKNVVDAMKFDDPSSHGLSNCMKAVDYIIERTDCFLFIELKDPQRPGIPSQDLHAFTQRFHSGKLAEDLKYKYRDSFLYEWSSGRANKPIDYLVLVALSNLTTAEMVNRTDDLKRKLPMQKSNSIPWIRPFVRSCVVFNIAEWNKTFSDLIVTRLSTI